MKIFRFEVDNDMINNNNLASYTKIVGKLELDKIHAEAEKLSGKHILCINSTYQGGGVAEILNSLVPLFDQVGVDFGWRILHGTPDFFTITKKFHNALQGNRINLSQRKKDIYYQTTKRFSTFTHIDHDLVVIHDPQPLPLISFYEKKQPWIFRCHIDISEPNKEVWNYLKAFIQKYDRFVVSLPEYKKEDLNIPQTVIRPAIDPVAVKNKPVSESKISKFLEKFGVDRKKPIISQVSRFDPWKDPIGVVKVFERVKKKTDCQLVLLGQFATDDPEGQKVFQALEKKVDKSPFKNDIKLLIVDNAFLVNCLQRASSVVIQKSLKEGFGLTVSEALYKETPVVASKVGGIPTQVINGVNGFLHNPKDYNGFSDSIIKLLKDEKLRTEMGKAGKEHIKKNFLITRLILDWLMLLNKELSENEKKLSSNHE
ncbi:MAG: glycosyltransferase [Bacteroidales bacterium]|nr:glycosyltransferase [Bacteroidales bacterium]